MSTAEAILRTGSYMTALASVTFMTLAVDYSLSWLFAMGWAVLVTILLQVHAYVEFKNQQGLP